MKSTVLSLMSILLLVACSSEQPGSVLSPVSQIEPASGETVSAGPVSIHTVTPFGDVEAGGSVDVKCHYLDALGVRVPGLGGVAQPRECFKDGEDRRQAVVPV